MAPGQGTSPANGHGELYSGFRGEEVGFRRNHPRKNRPDWWGLINIESREGRAVRWLTRGVGCQRPRRELGAPRVLMGRVEE